MHLPDAKKCTFRRNGVILPTACCGEKNAHSSENSAAKKRTFRKKGVILFLACGGQKVQFPDAKTCTFRRKGVIWPTACCGGKVHIHQKIWRRKSAHSEGKVWFCFLLVAVTKCISQMRKSAHSEGMVWLCLLRVAAKKCTFIGKFGGEKAHIPKECCDFASCLLRRESKFPKCEKEHIPKERCDFAYCVLRRKSAHSDGKVWFYSLLLACLLQNAVLEHFWIEWNRKI